MAITLYINKLSPPARACMMTAKVLGLDVDYKELDLIRGDHKKEEFLKINFQHTVPTLTDGDLVLWESGAINTYLATVYGKNDAFYPKDPKKRALVDQRLFFDASMLFPRIRNLCYPVLFLGEIVVPDKSREAVREALDFANGYLEGQQFVVGKDFSLADVAWLASIETYQGIGFDLSPYKNLGPWLERCKKLVPDYEALNVVPSNTLGDLLKSKIGMTSL